MKAQEDYYGSAKLSQETSKIYLENYLMPNEHTVRGYLVMNFLQVSSRQNKSTVVKIYDDLKEILLQKFW